MEFTSERLFFREYEISDYDLFASVISSERVMEYAYMDHITDENRIREHFEKMIENRNQASQRSTYEFAVFTGSEREYIGFADIMLNYHFSRIKFGEIGYFLLPDFWGRGYATEIARTLANFSFNSLRLQKVVASCNANNKQSENVMKKIGMLKEGVMRKERYKNGRWDDELRYGILADEWEALQKSALKFEA